MGRKSCVYLPGLLHQKRLRYFETRTDGADSATCRRGIGSGLSRDRLVHVNRQLPNNNTIDEQEYGGAALEETLGWVRRFCRHRVGRDTAALTVVRTCNVRVRSGSDEAAVGHDAYANNLAWPFNAYAELNRAVLSDRQTAGRTFVELTSTR